MVLNVIAYGIARDILGSDRIDLSMETGATVEDLRNQLIRSFPDFEKLRHIALAVNCEYAEDATTLSDADEIVIIPPVSGG